MKHLLALVAILCINPLHAATISCTIDGTGPNPKLTFGPAKDCAFTGKNGSYQLTTRREPKFVLASCWRDGGGGDATACTSAIVRHSENTKILDVFGYPYPGSGTSNPKSAWISITYSY